MLTASMLLSEEKYVELVSLLGNEVQPWLMSACLGV